MERKTALIAMSGGVDSSVCAYLMQKKNFNCIGVTLRLCNQDILNSNCCTDNDINDACLVANKLNIEHKVINYGANFKNEVINRFIAAYESGATPNPCIDCNRYIKFKGMFEALNTYGADYIVTGHYARVEYSKELNKFLLKKGIDHSKDQSYVLYSLTQEQLKHIILPLGDLPKNTVREIAAQNGFVNAGKKDSQDLCFVPDKDYASFIKNYTNKEYPQGDFIDTNGNVLGKHKGIINYTIGQRKGLGLSLPAPMFVCEKCIEENKVVLTYGEALYSSSLDANELNLIAVDKIDKPLKVKARVRYNQKEQSATVVQTSEDSIHIEFEEPQRAITKGQAVVFYDNDIVIGGATII